MTSFVAAGGTSFSSVATDSVASAAAIVARFPSRTRKSSR